MLTFSALILEFYITFWEKYVHLILPITLTPHLFLLIFILYLASQGDSWELESCFILNPSITDSKPASLPSSHSSIILTWTCELSFIHPSLNDITYLKWRFTHPHAFCKLCNLKKLCEVKKMTDVVNKIFKIAAVWLLNLAHKSVRTTFSMLCVLAAAGQPLVLIHFHCRENILLNISSYVLEV